jgi:hypothetical protein
MAERTLLEGYLYNGTRYGPGKTEMPDDDQSKDFLARVDELEERAKARQELVLADALELLPSGHPYREMFATVSNQPEGVDAEDVQAGDPDLPVEFRPDGFTVSGIGSPNPEEFKPGLQRSSVPAMVPPEQEASQQAQKPQKLAPEGMQQKTPEQQKQAEQQAKQQAEQKQQASGG